MSSIGPATTFPFVSYTYDGLAVRCLHQRVAPSANDQLQSMSRPGRLFAGKWSERSLRPQVSSILWKMRLYTPDSLIRAGFVLEAETEVLLLATLRRSSP